MQYVILKYLLSYDMIYKYMHIYIYIIYNPFACASSISNKISKLNADL